ncbi:ABC transporter substrate-binding protein [Micromonospora craniellae]|nr:extracellular solute-binding protein [Micromonospora craniellae]QOC92286.1 extracellular solute-binding protein [Micromonospora craniellae]
MDKGVHTGLPRGLSRRSFLGVGGAALVATALSACGRGSGGGSAASLTYHTPSFGVEQITPYLATFTQQYGSSVTTSAVPRDYHPTTETRLRAGTDLTVVTCDDGYPQKWLKEGWLVAVEDAMDLSKIKNDMYPSLLESVTDGGKVVALPGNGLTKVMVFNESVLGAGGFDPADDWEEFFTQLTALKRAGAAQYPFVPMWTKAYSLITYFAIGDSYSRGAQEWFDPQTLSPRYQDDPAVIETIEFWRRMWAAELVPPDVLTADHNATLEIFAAGNAAYFQHNISQVLPVLNLDTTKYANVAGKIKLMMYPGATHECLTGSNWVCLTRSGAEAENGPDLARFLGALDRDDTYLIPTRYRAIDLGVEPGYAPVFDDPDVTAKWSTFSDPALVAEQKSKSRLLGPVIQQSWFTEWLDRTAAELQNALLGRTSVKEALANSASFAQEQR